MRFFTYLAFISLSVLQVSYLSAQIPDGSNQWNAAQCLMSIIFHNELARQVNWKGTGGVKIALYGTRIKEVLLCKYVHSTLLKY